MDFSQIMSVATATLCVLVVSHLCVFWVVRTLYPPPPPPQMVLAPQAPQVTFAPQPQVFAPPPVFTQPASIEQQNVVVPTYEAAVPAEAPRAEEPRRGPPPAEATSVKRDTGVGAANA